MSRLLYNGTRGGETGYATSQAVLKGPVKGGGLFILDQIPAFDFAPSALKDVLYREAAHRVIRLLLTDYTEEEPCTCIRGTYDEKFDTPEIAPLTFADDAYYLELFHGKTVAFEDMALSILSYLMTTAAKKNGVTNKIEILITTSGGTGKAAMADFTDVPDIGVVVFHPKGGMSRLQEPQMPTQKSDNTTVVSIEGNLDDTQTVVKQIFGDHASKAELATKRVQLSSAGLTGIGRLMPQVVYYVRVYLELLKEEKTVEGESVNVCVPIGSFGNILVAYFAKRMGLPIDRLICASNDNKTLSDFFETGTYDKNREFILITSPSMDILVSSNLERFLCLGVGCDAIKTREFMEALKTSGKYMVTEEVRKVTRDFVGSYATQKEVAACIRLLYGKTGCVIDTHTAVASKVYEDYREKSGDKTLAVITSTASPFKSFRAVMGAIAGDVNKPDDFTVLELFRDKTGVPSPPTVEEIRHAEIRHNRSCKSAEMESMAQSILSG